MKTCCSHADERWWGDGTMQKKKKSGSSDVGLDSKRRSLIFLFFPLKVTLDFVYRAGTLRWNSCQVRGRLLWTASGVWAIQKKEGADIINMKTFWKSSERQQQFKSAFYSLVVFEFRVVEMDGITPLRSASCSDHCRWKNTTHKFINSKEWREFNTVKILNLVTAYTIPEKSSTFRC